MGIDGEKLKKLRKENHLSQFQLAMEIEIEQQAISKIELNKRRYVSFETACKIADYFNVSVGDLR
jgi:transcriptional regulator with XRE-family HTH domain